jgi:hypothetical protein
MRESARFGWCVHLLRNADAQSCLELDRVYPVAVFCQVLLAGDRCLRLASHDLMSISGALCAKCPLCMYVPCLAAFRKLASGPAVQLLDRIGGLST